jgi:hypothetical protein
VLVRCKNRWYPWFGLVCRNILTLSTLNIDYFSCVKVNNLLSPVFTVPVDMVDGFNLYGTLRAHLEACFNLPAGYGFPPANIFSAGPR